MSIIDQAASGAIAVAEEAASVVSQIAVDSAAAIAAATTDEAVEAVKRLGVKRVFGALGVVVALAALAAALRWNSSRSDTASEETTAPSPERANGQSAKLDKDLVSS